MIQYIEFSTEFALNGFRECEWIVDRGGAMTMTMTMTMR
jgi:hypothetical protein